MKGVFNQKDLLLLLTKKELKARYKSTKLGFLWAFLNPLLQMIVLGLVFSFFFRIRVQNYPLFLLSGLLPWTYFSLSLTNGTDSLVSNRDLLRKVPFPREFLPLSTTFAQLFNFGISLLLFFIFLVAFGQRIQWSILLLPIAVILETFFINGLTFLTSSLDIYYRDVNFMVQALVFVWFYVTPVFYPIDFVPENYQWLYSLNPMVGIIDLFHTLLLGGKLHFSLFVPAIFISFISLILGYTVFKKREPYFADWI